MTELIRRATLTHYATLARSVGLDPVAMLRKVKLAPRLPGAPGPAHRSGQGSPPARIIDERRVENWGCGSQSGEPPIGRLALMIRDSRRSVTALESLWRFIHIHTEGIGS